MRGEFLINFDSDIHQHFFASIFIKFFVLIARVGVVRACLTLKHGKYSCQRGFSEILLEENISVLEF